MRCLTNFTNRCFFVLIAFLFSTGSLNAQVSGELKYEDLPRMIKANNGSVQSARLLVEASEKRTGHLMRSYLPNVKAFAGYEKFTTGTLDSTSQPYGGLEVSLNVFNFGKDSLEEDIRKASYRKSKAASNLNFNTKLHEARQIYWLIAYHNEIIEVLSKAKSQNKKILASANRRIKRGLTTKTDRLEFDMYAKDLETSIESLEHENKILLIALSKYLGTNVRSMAINIKSIPHDHDDALVDGKFNKKTSPGILHAQATSDLFKSRAYKSKKWWTPSIELYGGYSLFTQRQRLEFENRSDRDDTYIGIRLTMNLFDGSRSSSEAAAQSSKFAASEANSRYVAEEMSSEFEVVQEEMKHAHELTHVSEDKIKQGDVYFRRTLGEYDKGIKNSLDVLSSLQRIISFKTEYARVRLDYQNKKAALLKLKGI